ncbi:MAG: LysM peptidoglycan-binding domain-containing protein [Spirochaetaceae bacterium]|jgi:hypothetical protein|nr:LysM peptidoglycan-binding domain-containing protein [Spirochaetaceae bacterium]
MVSTIGLKLANGTFYSLLDESQSAERIINLTTARDDQRIVQIDLYRTYTRSMADALFAGALLVEDIPPRPKEDTLIKLIVKYSKNGELEADAFCIDQGKRGKISHLDTTLKSLNELDTGPEIGDFQLHSDEPPQELLEGLETKTGGRRKAAKKSKRGVLWGIVLALGALIILALGFLWGFIINKEEEPALPEEIVLIETPIPPPAAPVEEYQPTIYSSIPPELFLRWDRSAPVYSVAVPELIPVEGVLYRMQHGDTLWYVADHFYGNPWLYARIAWYNRIKNPDKIRSGLVIVVPPLVN